MNLARFTRFIIDAFRTPELWNMPETRLMATPQVLRKKAAKPNAIPKPFFSRTCTIFALMLLASVLPARVMACAVCFGQTDSDMAHGLNAGVLALFLIVLSVLGGFAAFFIYIAKRSAAGSSAQISAEREGDGFSLEASCQEKNLVSMRD